MPVMRHDAKKEQQERDRRRRQAAERRYKIAKESAERRRTEGGSEYRERVEEERKYEKKEKREVEKEAKRREKEYAKMGKSTIEIMQIPKIRPPEAKMGLARNEWGRKSTANEEPVKFKLSLTAAKILGKPERTTISGERDVATSQTSRGTVEEERPKRSIHRVTLRLTDESIKEEIPKPNCCWRLCSGIGQGSADLLKRVRGCPEGKCVCHKLGEIFKCSSCSNGICPLCQRFARLIKRSCACQEGRGRFCHRFPKLLKHGWTRLKRGCPYLCRCVAKFLICIWKCLKHGFSLLRPYVAKLNYIGTGLKRGCPHVCRCVAKILNWIWVGLKRGCPYLYRCMAKMLNCIWICLKRGCPYLFLCMATVLNCIWAGFKRGCPYVCRCMAKLLNCICCALKDALCSGLTAAITS